MKKLYFFVILSFIITGFLYSQTDIGPDTKVNVPGNWSMQPGEKVNNNTQMENSVVPQDLMRQYLDTKRTGDEAEKERLGKEIEKYLNPTPGIIDLSTQPAITKTGLPFEGDWGIGDVPVHMGDIAFAAGYRQLDMKLGEDGYLYVCVNRRNVSGYLGYILVYKSSDGGAHWSIASGATNTGAYFGQVSMLVEKRHATNNDSTRILLYFTMSASAAMDNATLGVCSFRRDGSAWYALTAGTPASGNKFQFPTACSDGMYYSTATYMHCIVQEVTNAGVHVATRHYRSTDWGYNHTSGIINTTWDDFYPSAAFSREINTGSDTIYIAIERRFSTTSVAVRILTIPEIPSTAFFTYYLTPYTGVKYEKPCMTIQQEYSTTPRKILVTSTRDSAGIRSARYHTSTNGGTSWDINYTLGSLTMQTDFTTCNSDSTTAGTGNFIAAFVNVNGDSITVRRGVLGSMGTYLYKRNAHYGTGMLAPAVAVYKEAGVKYSALAYAGNGPTNIYFNQENLPSVGITPIGNKIPDKFELIQNYPNPFNPNTTIKFNIPSSEFVILKVYDVLGREAATLINENLKAGEYNVNFNATNLTSGVYFYKLTTNTKSDVKKMVVTK
jgi:hypothetical protein